MKRLLHALMLALVGTVLWASPALRLRTTVVQPDGTELIIVKCGDEHMSFLTTTDGYVVAKGTKGYCYVQRLVDGTSKVSEMCAHNEQGRGISEQHWLSANGITHSAVVAQNAGKRTRISTRLIGKSERPHGRHTYPIVLVNFSDMAFLTVNPIEYFKRHFNEKGYSEGGAVGSVSDYFKAQSKGIYSPEFDVVGMVTLPKPRAYYGAHTASSTDAHVREMVKSAVSLAEKQGADFKKYKNSFGSVPLVGVVFAGVGENTSWDDDAVWPSFYTAPTAFSEGSIASFLVVNELIASLQSNGTQNDTTYQTEGIGTFCHEFSHFLGLPDFYNTFDSSSLVGMSWWSIMDYGQYWKNGAVPMGYSAYEKNFMGWLRIDTLKTEKQVVRINALGSSRENAYYILNDNDASGNEYYILENRQPSAWYPERLGSGMFVTHVDYNATAWAENMVNTVKDRRRMSFVPADNSIKAENLSTPADYQGDLFPGLTENRELRDNAAPGFRQYNGGSMGKYLTCISDTNGTVSFVYMAEGFLETPKNINVKPNETVTSLNVEWDAVVNATAYMVEVLDGDKVIFSQHTEEKKMEIGGFDNVKNLTVAVSATADNYIDSEASRIAFANPVGVESTIGGIDADTYSIFTTSGVKVDENVSPENIHATQPKGVYIIKGRNVSKRILIK